MLQVFPVMLHVFRVMLHVFSVTLQETRATLQDCTNSVPAVYQSSKTVKNSQTAKMTIGVPIVTCLHRVRQIHKVRVRVRRLRSRPPNTESRIIQVREIPTGSPHVAALNAGGV